MTVRSASTSEEVLIKKRITKSLVLGAALGVSVTTLVGLAWGQTKPSLQQFPGASTEVSDKELQAYAKSYVEFHKLRTLYEPRLIVVKTPEEKTRIQQEAVAKFGAALEGEGLTMEQYAALFQTVNAADHLREKDLKLSEDETAKS